MINNMTWSADAPLRKFQTQKLVSIVFTTQYHGDHRIDDLYYELVSLVRRENRGSVNFDTNNAPFINFQTAQEELRDVKKLFKLSALSYREESTYKMNKKTPDWESIKTEEERIIPPFVLKFACLSREGNQLSIDDPSYYKVFVKLRKRRLINLWDYATTLGNEVDLDAHRRLFSILLRIQDLAQKSVNISEMDDPIKTPYVSNVNYDVPWLHFNFICGPLGKTDMYRCNLPKTPTVVQTSIPKKKEFATLMKNKIIPRYTPSGCCNMEEDLTLLLTDGREYDDENPFKGAILNILPPKLTESWIKGTILFGTLMFLSDKNTRDDIIALDFYIEMAGKMIKEMFGGISSTSTQFITKAFETTLDPITQTMTAPFISGLVSIPSVLYVQTWQLYKFQYWEKNELNKDWSTYLSLCPTKCIEMEEKYNVSTLSSIFGKYFWTKPIQESLHALGEKMKKGSEFVKEGFESRPVSDHEIEHASMFGLRAEKSLANRKLFLSS